MENVKRFDDLSDPDVLGLTDDQVKRWVDIECAVAGVPLLPAEPVKPLAVDFSTDLTGYEVGSFVFADADAAAKVLTLLKSVKVYQSEYCNAPGYKRVLKPNNDIAIEAKPFFSPEHWDTVKADAANAARLENAYNEATRAYAKVVEARKRIVNDINARVEEVHQREQARLRIKSDYDRYLDLAGGNEEIAKRFLNNAWANEPERVKEVFPEELAL